ncbi:hypothetical protein DJ71_06535, partial [Halorubrum sp. E3]
RRSGSGPAFAALASDEGVPLDGGLTHYAGGGTFRAKVGPTVPDGTTLSLFGTEVGTLRAGDADAGAPGVEWTPVDVLANGECVTGLSLFAARGDRFGVKVVCPDREFEIGESVTLDVVASDDPIRLGVG